MAQREWAEKDYYKILGVPESATKADIKKAYRKLAQQYHPDANKGDTSAEARFKEISEAHATLSNDEKRKEYDQMRALLAAGGDRIFGFSPGGGGRNVRVNIGDLFGDTAGGAGFFDDLFGFRGAATGQDIETQVMLSFDDAIYGTTIEINNAKVRIPPGVRDGARIKVRGKGAPGPRGAPPGDLYVVVSVARHPVFEQGANADLRVRVPVTFTEAALGAQVDVPTLDGRVTVKVPPGTQHGKTMRVRGRGGPRGTGGNGDLLVTIEVEVPQKLSKKERQLLEQFAAVHKGSPRAHLEGAMPGSSRAEAS